jgi:hypothetical protein
MGDFLDSDSSRAHETWSPHPNALEQADTLFGAELQSSKLEGLGIACLGEGKPILDNYLRHAYSDALIDLGELRDEIRMHIALGALYVYDFNERLKTGEASIPQMHSFTAAGMPVDVLATYSTYSVPVFNPSTLFRSPHASMSKYRVMSLWLAAQLFDDALFRAITAMDRVAILLWCAAERPIRKNKAGVEHFPAFRSQYLDQLDDSYGAMSKEWRAMKALVESDLFETTKNLRDNFTHRWRERSALHGAIPTTYDDGAGTSSTTEALMTAQEHLDLVVKAHRIVDAAAVIAIPLVSHAVGEPVSPASQD